MTNKEFAEKNAGKYFQFRNKKVRVIGYCNRNDYSILVSVPWWAGFGWGGGVADSDAILVVSSKARKFWYVNEIYWRKWG